MILDVYVFDSSLTAIGAVNSVTELIWIESFCNAGSFEFWCPLNDSNISLLKENNFVWIERPTLGLIEYLETITDTDGERSLHIQGRLCECFLDFRVVYPAVSLSGEASKVLRFLVEKTLVNPDDPNRRVPYFVIEETPEFGNKLSYQQTGNSVLLEASNICSAYGLGFQVQFDVENQQLKFRVLQSMDRTIEQEERDPVVISSDFDDILSSTYYHNLTDLKNLAYVAGEDSGIDRKVVEVGELTGFFRRELFVDARDIQSESETGEPIDPENYSDMLSDRGKTKLQDYRDVQAYEAKVRTFGSTGYTFEKDYFLGDFVTVQDKQLGLQISVQITALEITYTREGKQFELTFGTSQPTIAAILKRKGVQ